MQPQTSARGWRSRSSTECAERAATEVADPRALPPADGVCGQIGQTSPMAPERQLTASGLRRSKSFCKFLANGA